MLTGERALGATFAPSEIGWIDFETKSRTTTPQVSGTYRYAIEADALILAWGIGDSEIRRTAVLDFDAGPLTWAMMPDMFKHHHERVRRGEAVWAAWNAGFDKAIWNFATLGFPILESRHIIDVMAQATAAGLPPDLKRAAIIAGGAAKDDRGKELIRLFCLPTSTATPQSHPEDWAAFLAYAGDDIAALRSVFKVTRQLSKAEWAEYWAMEAINERGVGIDRAMVHQAAQLAREDKSTSSSEIYAQTQGEVPSVDHVKLMTEWLLRNLPAEGRQILLKREEEVDEDGELVRPAKFQLTRARIVRLLAYCAKELDSVNPTAVELLALMRAQRILQIRLYGGSKTPAKFSKMLAQEVDGTLFGQYVFNGAAQTGRASSKGVQVHNLARDTLAYEHEAIEALLSGIDYRNFAILGGDTPVSRKLSLLIRPAFVPRPGCDFVWSDWSQIEARVLPWLAGDDPGALARLQIFRDVDADPRLPDLYTRTASVLSHVPIEQVTKPMRQRGKVAELALGFGGGLGALQAMGANYGLYIDEAEGRETVARWRGANAWCVRFWEALWRAINAALQAPEVLHQVGRLAYIYLPNYLGGSLLCLLPSGRFLTYRGIRLERVADLDDDDNIVGYSIKLRFSRGYGRVVFWHGMACENVVQAVAADCLRGTLRRLVDSGYDVRLHTHDEILLEAFSHEATDVETNLRVIMQRGFDWSEGLPLMSAETIAPYYSKVEA